MEVRTELLSEDSGNSYNSIVYSAHQDSRTASDQILQANTKRWLAAVLQQELPDRPVTELLQSGRILGMVAEIVEGWRKGVTNAPKTLCLEDLGARRYRVVLEDINKFTQVCSASGLAPRDICTTTDVVDCKNANAVCRSLWNLAETFKEGKVVSIPAFVTSTDERSLRRVMSRTISLKKAEKFGEVESPTSSPRDAAPEYTPRSLARFDSVSSRHGELLAAATKAVMHDIALQKENIPDTCIAPPEAQDPHPASPTSAPQPAPTPQPDPEVAGTPAEPTPQPDPEAAGTPATAPAELSPQPDPEAAAAPAAVSPPQMRNAGHTPVLIRLRKQQPAAEGSGEGAFGGTEMWDTAELWRQSSSESGTATGCDSEWSLGCSPRDDSCAGFASPGRQKSAAGEDVSCKGVVSPGRQEGAAGGDDNCKGVVSPGRQEGAAGGDDNCAGYETLGRQEFAAAEDESFARLAMAFEEGSCAPSPSGNAEIGLEGADSAVGESKEDDEAVSAEAEEHVLMTDSIEALQLIEEDSHLEDSSASGQEQPDSSGSVPGSCSEQPATVSAVGVAMQRVRASRTRSGLGNASRKVGRSNRSQKDSPRLNPRATGGWAVVAGALAASAAMAARVLMQQPDARDYMAQGWNKLPKPSHAEHAQTDKPREPGSAGLSSAPARVPSEPSPTGISSASQGRAAAGVVKASSREPGSSQRGIEAGKVSEGCWWRLQVAEQGTGQLARSPDEVVAGLLGKSGKEQAAGVGSGPRCRYL